MSHKPAITVLLAAALLASALANERTAELSSPSYEQFDAIASSANSLDIKEARANELLELARVSLRSLTRDKSKFDQIWPNIVLSIYPKLMQLDEILQSNRRATMAAANEAPGQYIMRLPPRFGR